MKIANYFPCSAEFPTYQDFKNLDINKKIATIFFVFLATLCTIGILTFPIIKICIDRFKVASPNPSKIVPIFDKAQGSKPPSSVLSSDQALACENFIFSKLQQGRKALDNAGFEENDTLRKEYQTFGPLIIAFIIASVNKTQGKLKNDCEIYKAFADSYKTALENFYAILGKPAKLKECAKDYPEVTPQALTFAFNSAFEMGNLINRTFVTAIPEIAQRYGK